MNADIFNNYFIDDETKYKYYIIPEKFPLFKATRRPSIEFEDFKPYFFGLVYETTDEIDEYENLYGAIYKFETTKELRLLALDDPQTIQNLYNNTNDENIQRILINNYGLNSGIRNSVADKDREIANYLCENNFEGYAINTMKADLGGKFHPEFLICDAKNCVEQVDIITKDENKIRNMVQEYRLKEQSVNLREARRNKKRPIRSPVSSPPKRLFDAETTYDSPPKSSIFNFPTYDSPPISKKLFGGKKYNKSKKLFKGRKYNKSKKLFKGGKKYNKSKKLFKGGKEDDAENKKIAHFYAIRSIERNIAEKKLLEQERLEQERLEQERLEQERREKDRAEKGTALDALMGYQ